MIVSGIVYKLALALLSCLAYFAMLRLFDKLARRDFKEAYAIFKTDPMALAVYHGALLIGAALIISRSIPI